MSARIETLFSPAAQQKLTQDISALSEDLNGHLEEYSSLSDVSNIIEGLATQWDGLQFAFYYDQPKSGISKLYDAAREFDRTGATPPAEQAR